MLDMIDAAELYQEVRMERQVHNKSFLILEGRGDQDTLLKFVDDDKCSVVIAQCKENAINLVEMLEDDGYTGFVAVVDSDFEEVALQSDNIIETGHRDMDVVVFESEALDRFLHARANQDDLNNFIEKEGGDFRCAIYGKVYPLSCLRVLNSKRNWSLNFKKLSFSFVDHETLDIDRDALIDEIIAASRDGYEAEDIANRCDIIQRQQHSAQKISNGHDIMTILGIALRQCIASIRNPHTGGVDPRTWKSEVELLFRVGFYEGDLKKTMLYQGIKGWEKRNNPYLVFTI